MDSDVIIGLEVHIQLNTKSKLFCPCTTQAKIPNTGTCQTCLGHPGSKPVLNKLAIDDALKFAISIGCAINREMRFSRKTYFYPDLAKNFQITQFEIPLGEKGVIELDSGKKICIRRVHVEEDPASLIHEGAFALVDYNRSGIPLVELVTEPDMASPDEAREFMKKVLAVLTYLKIFDQNLGVIKADANVSIKETGYERVEIKNITGFKEIESALNYEVARQKSGFEKNEKIIRETRGWDAEKGITKPQRTKEEEADYGYIIEPDLAPVIFSDEWVLHAKSAVPELAQDKSRRFAKQLNIDAIDAKIIAADPSVAALFEQVISHVDPVLAARWIRRELLRVLNLEKKSLEETQITALHLIELFQLIEKRIITDRIGQQLMTRMVSESFSPNEYVAKQGLSAVSAEGEIQKFCTDAIAENPDAVADYKKGEEKALNFIFGKVMQKSKNKAAPDVIRKILKQELSR